MSERVAGPVTAEAGDARKGVARRKIGLIVNPLAGIGGRVGLKGSDGREIVERAFALGAEPVAPSRSIETLSLLATATDGIRLATYPGEMGADEAYAAGVEPTVLGSIDPGRTDADDTRRAARDLAAWGAELIVFAGGDGTARNVCEAVGDSVPVIGIPAGVKIHSSVFALNPRRAAELIREYVLGRVALEPMEVMDIDEDLFRAGIVSARLYGYLRVPYVRNLVQRAKAASRADTSTARSIAFGVLDRMERDPDAYYVLGPGSTVKAIGDELGIDKTLLGVDVVHRRRLVAKDASEKELLAIVAAHRSRIVVTVIGGQGYVFGRGNQQLSPRVIRSVGRENLLVVATADKLLGLRGPLLVDTGDLACDQYLAGYIRVITGERDEVVWAVAC